MKKTLFTLITVGTLLVVSCTKDPVATETFIREDVIGEWTVNQVAYSGEMPNPINPSALMQFSGIGTQLYGKINIYEMPDTGNLHIDFVANLNTIQVPVSLISGGSWLCGKWDASAACGVRVALRRISRSNGVSCREEIAVLNCALNAPGVIDSQSRMSWPR